MIWDGVWDFGRWWWYQGISTYNASAFHNEDPLLTAVERKNYEAIPDIMGSYRISFSKHLKITRFHGQAHKIKYSLFVPVMAGLNGEQKKKKQETALDNLD